MNSTVRQWWLVAVVVGVCLAYCHIGYAAPVDSLSLLQKSVTTSDDSISLLQKNVASSVDSISLLQKSVTTSVGSLAHNLETSRTSVSTPDDSLSQKVVMSRIGIDSLSLLQKIVTYRTSIATSDDTLATNLYLQYHFNTKRRNFTLATIPTMHSVSRGAREFAGESLTDLLLSDGIIVSSNRRLHVSTVPRYRTVMTPAQRYLLPNIYGKTLFGTDLLSPFNVHNTKLYKYKIVATTGNIAELSFRRKRRSTQLVSGTALVDKESGRIVYTHIRGEFDNIIFYLDATMGETGLESLYPKTCTLSTEFNFLGNKISADYYSYFSPSIALADSIHDSHDLALMDSLRPMPLNGDLARLYHRQDSLAHVRDSLSEDDSESLGSQLWHNVGSKVVVRTKGRFGNDSQGSYRLSPLLNPLYIGYSKRKGITYKLRFRANYAFTPNRDLALRVKAGYSFKLKEVYYTVPLTFNYNKRKHAYLQFELSNGNRTRYTKTYDDARKEILDSIGHDDRDMKTFRDFSLKLVNNYDFTPQWGGQIGLVYHRRSAVDKAGFRLLNLESVYYSFAPWVELRYRPWGYGGPTFTVDYERGFHVGKADVTYERIEVDAFWRRGFNRLRSLSMRAGGGLYTRQGKGARFLDFSNFREESMPSDWNEDWSGSFQLLGSARYNSSKYYVRANVTYDSPLMLLSYIPIVGRLMETERIYVNALVMSQMHPYMEFGYGFSTRLLSVGAFVAMRNGKYDGIGCRVGLELFRDW